MNRRTLLLSTPALLAATAGCMDLFGVDIDEAETAVLSAINDYRAEHDTPPLEHHDELAAVAREHSQDMAERDYFDHTSPDGTDPHRRVIRAGIGCSTTAENIAGVERSTDPESVADDTLTLWTTSEPHERILRLRVPYAGVGITEDSGELLVTLKLCG